MSSETDVTEKPEVTSGDPHVIEQTSEESIKKTKLDDDEDEKKEEIKTTESEVREDLCYDQRKGYDTQFDITDFQPFVQHPIIHIGVCIHNKKTKTPTFLMV